MKSEYDLRIFEVILRTRFEWPDAAKEDEPTYLTVHGVC